jgi:hypothetical protein
MELKIVTCQFDFAVLQKPRFARLHGQRGFLLGLFKGQAEVFGNGAYIGR